MRLQSGELPQDFAISRVIILKAPLDRRQFAITNIRRAFRQPALLKKRLLLVLQLTDGRVLFPGVLLPLQFNFFQRFLELRDPNRDLALLLFERSECDNLAPKFREIPGLLHPFAAEMNFRTLEVTFLAPQRHARALTADFESKFPQTCSYEAHKCAALSRQSVSPLRSQVSPARSNLRELSYRQSRFYRWRFP